MLSSVSRSFYSRAPSVHQRCHSQHSTGIFYGFVFHTVTKSIKAWVKSPDHTRVRARVSWGRPCPADTIAWPEPDSVQVAAAIPDGPCPGGVCLWGSHRVFSHPAACSTLEHAAVLCCGGGFLCNPWSVLFMPAIARTENCVDSCP